MNTPAYIFSDTSLTAFIDGAPITVNSDHPYWSAIIDAVRETDWSKVAELARPVLRVTRYLDGNPDFTIDNEIIRFRGEELPDLLTDRLFALMNRDMDTKPLANFITRLYANPDSWIVDQLLPFVEKGKLPITPDGHFLAYKRVREDFSDVYSGTVSYPVGAIVDMPRRKVDSNRDQTCSYGLHACSLNYLKHFSGARIVAVKIDPADVVAIPADYNDTKLRCCRMEVVAELPAELATPAWDAPIFSYDNEEDDETENYDTYTLTSYDTLTDTRFYWSGSKWIEKDDVYEDPQFFSGPDAFTDASEVAYKLIVRFNVGVAVEDQYGNREDPRT